MYQTFHPSFDLVSPGTWARTTTTLAKTSHKNVILAVLKFIALIPCRSIWQMLVNISVVVRDKSNLNIGHEDYPKTVRFFFYRDLSAGHVTSFSMWLACWTVRVVASFYGRECTELVSIWFVFQFYLALCLHVLYFYFSFHCLSWRNLCLFPTVVEF